MRTTPMTTPRHWLRAGDALENGAAIGDTLPVYVWEHPDAIGTILARTEFSLIVAEGNAVMTLDRSNTVGTTMFAASASPDDVQRAFDRLMTYLGGWDALNTTSPERLAREND